MLTTIINHMPFLLMIKIPVVFAHFGLHGFFILSAFLISSILYKEKEKFGEFKPYAKNFYIKRALRILPVYFILRHYPNDWFGNNGYARAIHFRYNTRF